MTNGTGSKCGRKRLAGKMVQVTAYLPVELHVKLQAEAQKEFITVGQVVRQKLSKCCR